jgi:hypothetical protein
MIDIHANFSTSDSTLWFGLKMVNVLGGCPKSLSPTCNPLKCKRKKNHLDSLRKKLDPSPHILMKPYLLCTCKLIVQANANIEPYWNLHWQKQGDIVKHKLTNSLELTFFLPCCQPTTTLVFGPINNCICYTQDPERILKHCVHYVWWRSYSSNVHNRDDSKWKPIPRCCC